MSAARRGTQAGTGIDRRRFLGTVAAGLAATGGVGC